MPNQILCCSLFLIVRVGAIRREKRCGKRKSKRCQIKVFHHSNLFYTFLVDAFPAIFLTFLSLGGQGGLHQFALILWNLKCHLCTSEFVAGSFLAFRLNLFE